jgi:hypothetical protein
MGKKTVLPTIFICEGTNRKPHKNYAMVEIETKIAKTSWSTLGMCLITIIHFV